MRDITSRVSFRLDSSACKTYPASYLALCRMPWQTLKPRKPKCCLTIFYIFIYFLGIMYSTGCVTFLVTYTLHLMFLHTMYMAYLIHNLWAIQTVESLTLPCFITQLLRLTLLHAFFLAFSIQIQVRCTVSGYVTVHVHFFVFQP
jgi:hypothetical protein